MLSLLFLALLSAHQVLGELCANEMFTVTREGQDRSSIISVPNGGLVTVLYNFTHPPLHPNQYKFGLHTRPRNPITSAQYFSVIYTNQSCGNETLRTESCNQGDLVYIRAGNCTQEDCTQGDFVTDLYLLMVTGNNMTNGTVIECSYSLNRTLCECDEPSVTIKVYDNDEECVASCSSEDIAPTTQTTTSSTENSTTSPPNGTTEPDNAGNSTTSVTTPPPNPSPVPIIGEAEIISNAALAVVLAGVGVILQLIIISCFLEAQYKCCGSIAKCCCGSECPVQPGETSTSSVEQNNLSMNLIGETSVQPFLATSPPEGASKLTFVDLVKKELQDIRQKLDQVENLLPPRHDQVSGLPPKKI